jgi:cytochrome c-type biogenesis protein CcmH/NrfG
MVRHSSNRHKPISAQADTLANDASDLYVRSYSKGEIDQTALREALIKAKRALVLAPGDYHNLILVARIFSDFNDQQSHAQSLKYYERAIALRPDLPVAYEEKAQFLMDWLDPPDPAEAERLARKALKTIYP